MCRCVFHGVYHAIGDGVAEDADNEPTLTDEEIEALVEHAQDGGFDDGEFRIHDFGAESRLRYRSGASWTVCIAIMPKRWRRPSVPLLTSSFQ